MTTAPTVPATEPALQRGAERRVWQLADLEIRESGNGDDFTLTGHAARFGVLSEDLGGFKEIISPGFFRDALGRKPDVRCLINHDSYPVLARTTAGTLELQEDELGLRIWARVAKDTSFGRDLATSMQRGDIDQMSFAFTLNDRAFEDWNVDADGIAVRTLLPGGCRDLYDVSVVTYPAYQETDAQMRKILRRAVAAGAAPAEQRADVPALYLLLDMWTDAQCFLSWEAGSDDYDADKELVDQMLGTLSALIAAEAAEAPYDPENVPYYYKRPLEQALEHRNASSVAPADPAGGPSSHENPVGDLASLRLAALQAQARGAKSQHKPTAA